MNRFDLQQLAAIRLNEAQHLLSAGSYSGAYYLAGYAVECALKAVIAKQTQQFDFPDKERVRDSYTHDFSKLIKLARLEQARRSGSELSVHWDIVKDWSEASRYIVTSESAAGSLIQAISKSAVGVFAWLSTHW